MIGCITNCTCFSVFFLIIGKNVVELGVGRHFRACQAMLGNEGSGQFKQF
jgi:hypothetical protein